MIVLDEIAHFLVELPKIPRRLYDISQRAISNLRPKEIERRIDYDEKTRVAFHLELAGMGMEHGKDGSYLYDHEIIVEEKENHATIRGRNRNKVEQVYTHLKETVQYSNPKKLEGAVVDMVA